jgi:hypothetical protein
MCAVTAKQANLPERRPHPSPTAAVEGPRVFRAGNQSRAKSKRLDILGHGAAQTKVGAVAHRREDQGSDVSLKCGGWRPEGPPV